MSNFEPTVDPVEALIALLKSGTSSGEDEVAAAPPVTPKTLAPEGEINEEIEFYPIELDEAEQTPDALAARDRILEGIGLLPGLLPDPSIAERELTSEYVDSVFSTLVAADLWEDDELVISRRAGYALPPRDLVVPGLVKWGYHPEVEVQIDLDAEETATLTFLLDTEDDAVSPTKVRVLIETPAGDTVSTVVSELGVAVLTGIPREQLQHLLLHWQAPAA